ncbi:MAG: hypothetical protein CMJ58_20570 [Planctomycetaceae bacterium]|nr:hypothetical protein [Planctomycetaceae bacterium]
MPLTDPALWRRLQEFAFDVPGAALPFSVRLAREHGWSLRLAQRAIDEYRRFLYLTQVAAEPVCPSEQIDAVWHLHLCYSRSYWDELCGRVLGRPLHHDPTAGGGAQLDYHRGLYDATLAAYQREFDAAPPRLVWPATDERFELARQPRTIDPSRYWLVRKPPLAAAWRRVRRRWIGAASAGALAIVPLWGAGFNPLDMRGPPFLALYAGLVLCAAVAALALRLILRGGDEAAALPELDAYEAAVLAGGERRACQIALAELALAGAIKECDVSERTVMTVKPEPPGAHPLVQKIYRAIEARGMATPIEAIAAGAPEAARIGARLEDAGLVPNAGAAWAARIVPALVAASPLALGVMKIFVGLDRHKPVLFLVLMCVATAVLAVLFMRPVMRTRRGARLLRQLQRDHRPLKDDRQFYSLDEPQQALAMGLFGLSMLSIAPGMTAELYQWMFPRNSGGGWSSGGCSAGCGGGGCGGGGCGGGCGGCGGD